MTNYAKREKAYERLEIDAKAIKRAYDKRKKAKKFPTSIRVCHEWRSDNIKRPANNA